MSSDSTDDPGSTSADCSPRALDLRSPPTRADLAMRPDKPTTTWSCDDGFPVDLQLPADRATSLTSRQLSVDSYRNPDPARDAPSTIDVHSTALEVDEAVTTAQRIASELGMDVAALSGWQTSVAAATGVDDIKTPFLEARAGYLTIQLQAVHQGVSRNNYVHLVLSWGG